MKYLNDDHINAIGIDWTKLIGMIETTVLTLAKGDYSQPIKPYLRFGDPSQRIIAMPAFVGGEIEMCGIKWIASYPYNWRKGLPRAHSTMILNDPSNGKPLAIIESSLLSGLRTAAVSGLVLQHYAAVRKLEYIRLGIVGWGPIGHLHASMSASVLGDKLSQIMLFDIKGIKPNTIDPLLRPKTEITNDWREAYRNSDIFATCTVSNKRYIDELPPTGMLLLNVSLRDYMASSVRDIGAILVDDWDEVCRENTDIEQLHLDHGLTREATFTLSDMVIANRMADYDVTESIFFNPMGLAAFDVAIAAYYLREADRLGIGVNL
ncbi:2,3-diaminopropionate biosynthesis protein SbnB [Paenibacillus macquariensis]|uniref:Ornithine cyclodeaminase n=1 Tax=Paenibacillus macquariensis TaxID=948756 RepID=A0ABY1KB46_9BACL|nr:2,3-diaminopropionate biosynthesis protein SbnB [Paenibacillus macquariensis]MEC0089563.1 2,3-diaminopropionate biosynthesis protein SbnB [Paenibacillus macquariensis]OAB25769.1 2,3-diaminopropionate biosynthesis protein SbnB [Paenibacillus macquariensis subsp. macquariensis]SIR53765.1 ornithine cyclodeaminase [Paenibacillus macquariensis]